MSESRGQISTTKEGCDKKLSFFTEFKLESNEVYFQIHEFYFMSILIFPNIDLPPAPSLSLFI